MHNADASLNRTQGNMYNTNYITICTHGKCLDVTNHNYMYYTPKYLPTNLLVFHGPIRRRRSISILIIMQYFFIVFPGGDRPGPGARTSENCNTIL